MTSENGYPTSSNASSIGVQGFVVAGVSFPGGVRHDIAPMLAYVAQQFHNRVEHLVPGWCWGYSYRAIRGATILSNHASGTAIDCNAPNHPIGVATTHTFSAAKIAVVHQILAETGHTVRWGGDYTGRQDAMHFEINASLSAVYSAIARLPGHTPAPAPVPEIDMTPAQDALLQSVNHKLDQLLAGTNHAYEIEVWGRDDSAKPVYSRTDAPSLYKLGGIINVIRAEVEAIKRKLGA